MLLFSFIIERQTQGQFMFHVRTVPVFRIEIDFEERAVKLLENQKRNQSR